MASTVDNDLLLGSLPVPTVSLRHELPDGSVHFDWMLAYNQAPDSPLATFRLNLSPLDVKPGEQVSLERIADHRPAYLTYEGPISGGRGQVIRTARGQVLAAQWLTTNQLRLSIRWHAADDTNIVQEAFMQRQNSVFWMFNCIRICRCAELA